MAQKRGREEGGEEQRRACEAALCAAWASAAELRAPAPGKPELEAKLGTMVQVGDNTNSVFFLKKVVCFSFFFLVLFVCFVCFLLFLS